MGESTSCLRPFCSCHPTSEPGSVQGRRFSISTTSFQLLISQNYNFRNQHIIKYHSFYFVFLQEVCILLFSFMCSFAYSLWTCPQAPYFYCLDFVNVLVISTIKGSLWSHPCVCVPALNTHSSFKYDTNRNVYFCFCNTFFILITMNEKVKTRTWKIIGPRIKKLHNFFLGKTWLIKTNITFSASLKYTEGR